MAQSIIFTMPNATAATQIGSNWFEEVVKKAKDEGFDVKCLHGDDDTKENLEKALSDNPDAFLTGIGHGNANCFTGQNKKPMIVEGQSEGIVANHAWYPLSCEVGASLGKAVVRTGCPAFCGYDKKFVFALSKRSGKGGEAARGFMEANNAVPLTLIEGGDFDDAYKAAQAKFQEWVEKEKKEGKKRRVKWLIHDKRCMVAPATSDAYGDGSTKIKEAKMEKVEVNFELEKETQLYQVYGKVTEKDTGNPIEGAKIDIREKDMSATTDKNGNYKMPEGIESGEYTFKCVADGYKSKTKRVTIS